MNLLVITWSMIAAACGMLGLIQLFLWSNSRGESVYPLSALMAWSAVVVAILEMNLFSTADPYHYQQLLLWQNLAVAMVLIPMIWSVRAYLPAARTWAAVLITVLWGLCLLINFFLPGNLTFLEIQSIERAMTPWGDAFYVPNGTVNQWKWLADITVILIPLYMIDAVWQAPDPDRGKRGAVITAGVVLFMLFAGGQAIVVDAGLLEAPYMISAAFLSIVFALTWVLARDAVRARRLALEVTEAKHETERLMRANLLGEVASVLAHELNQPLAAILGNAQAAQKFLARPETDLDELREIVSDIVRDDKRARDIILNMRRMLRGDESLHTPVSMEMTVREVMEFLSKEFETNDITVRLSTSGEIPDVNGGPVALRQVMLNLLINAVRALEEAPASRREIQVHLRELRGGVEVDVRDFGPGIAEEVRSLLFDSFVTTKNNSLGMGLAICRRIVEARGGSLVAESAEDGGARFRFWLPGVTS